MYIYAYIYIYIYIYISVYICMYIQTEGRERERDICVSQISGDGSIQDTKIDTWMCEYLYIYLSIGPASAAITVHGIEVYTLASILHTFTHISIHIFECRYTYIKIDRFLNIGT
jgi:hypothetical protein